MEAYLFADGRATADEGPEDWWHFVRGFWLRAGVVCVPFVSCGKKVPGVSYLKLWFLGWNFLSRTSSIRPTCSWVTKFLTIRPPSARSASTVIGEQIYETLGTSQVPIFS